MLSKKTFSIILFSLTITSQTFAANDWLTYPQSPNERKNEHNSKSDNGFFKTTCCGCIAPSAIALGGLILLAKCCLSQCQK